MNSSADCDNRLWPFGKKKNITEQYKAVPFSLVDNYMPNRPDEKWQKNISKYLSQVIDI